jgi:hypothetical protein
MTALESTWWDFDSAWLAVPGSKDGVLAGGCDTRARGRFNPAGGRRERHRFPARTGSFFLYFVVFIPLPTGKLECVM